jgi:hypothetical protein
MSNNRPRSRRVIFFKPYPAEVGDSITIQGGPIGGDWEIIEVGERKIRLRCPISQKELEKDRFLFYVEERDDEPWPHGH